MRAALILGVLWVAARAAHADCFCNHVDNLNGTAWLHYEVTALDDVDDTKAKPAAQQLVLAGVRLHGVVGTGDTVAYHVGLDLAAGGTIGGGGFAYDVALFPVGVAVRLGQTSVIALGAGVGAMGATGSIDDAATFPLEAVAELGSGRVRLLARARASYVAGAAGRHDGAPSVPFADELDAMIGLRVGRHDVDYGFPSGSGYFVGAAYRELYGARFAGLVIGLSLDVGTQLRHREAMPVLRAGAGDGAYVVQ